MNFDPSTYDNFNIDDYNFITDSSKDIPVKLIKYAELMIKRYEVIGKLNLLLFDPQIAIDVEKGIFEFALIHININNLHHKFVAPVYLDKASDLIGNLSDNPNIDNKTLKNKILTKEIKPQLVAFLSPEQLHPERWLSILTKKTYREEVEANMATTDLYKCRKCGERKSKVTEQQTRSADEPSTKFITCLICYNTFTQ